MSGLISTGATAAAVGMTYGQFERSWRDMVREMSFPGPAKPDRYPMWERAAVTDWLWARSRRLMGFARIPLTRGLVALVDHSDAPAMLAFTWFAVPRSRGHNRFYAARCDADGRRVWMHRQLMDAPADKLVDHRDSDGLHNWRRNLRVATCQQNVWNRAVAQDGYRGVRQIATGWSAIISVGKGRRRLGVFASPEAAARAYDRAAMQLRGEFAALNFPRET